MALLLLAAQVLLWVRVARVLAEPVLQAAVTVSFWAPAVLQAPVRASPALPVLLTVQMAPLFWVPVAVMASLADSGVQPGPKGPSLRALELHAAGPAFHVVPGGLLALVVPLLPAPVSRPVAQLLPVAQVLMVPRALPVAQVLMVAPLVFLPVVPVSLQVSLVRPHFGPFAHENRWYFD